MAGGNTKTLSSSLAHELGHARTRIKGGDIKATNITSQKASSLGYFTEELEIDIVHLENKVRSSLNIELRDNYLFVPMLDVERSQNIEDYIEFTSKYGETVGAWLVIPKADDMHFDYNSVPKATSESKLKGIKFMLKTLKYKNNLNEWKHNKYKFKKNVTEAIIIGND